MISQQEQTLEKSSHGWHDICSCTLVLRSFCQVRCQLLSVQSARISLVCVPDLTTCSGTLSWTRLCQATTTVAWKMVRCATPHAATTLPLRTSCASGWWWKTSCTGQRPTSLTVSGADTAEHCACTSTHQICGEGFEVNACK